MNPFRLLVGGYYGCGNLGDDALLYGLVESLRDKPVTCSVLSGDLELTQKTTSCPAISRMDFKGIQRALSEHDALVFGGGSLFQDVTSLRSVFYYALLILLAKRRQKKVILLGQGVGPLRTPFGRVVTRWAFEKADAITVRDAESYAFLRKMKVSRPLEQTADLVFLLRSVLSSLKVPKADQGSTKIGFAPRISQGFGFQKCVDLFSELVLYCQKNGIEPLAIAMHHKEDSVIVDALKMQTGLTQLEGSDYLQGVFQQISALDGMVAMRLHGGVFAVLQSVPVMMLSYDPKVTSFAKQLGLPFVDLEGPDVHEKLIQEFEVFLKQKETFSNVMKEKLDNISTLSRRNIDFLFEHLS